MPKKSRTNYRSKDAPKKVFEKAEKVPGKNPKEVRQDVYGNILWLKDYPMTWEIDHIVAKSRGGSDDILNLQILSKEINRKLGASEDKKSRHDKKKEKGKKLSSTLTFIYQILEKTKMPPIDFFEIKELLSCTPRGRVGSY